MEKMKFPKVVKSRVADQVAQILYQKIVDGELEPGSRLPGEITLAKQLGVGRPTVREALNRLMGLGLIERGDYTCLVASSANEIVRSSLAPILLKNWETRELYEARMLIECNIVSLIIKKASPRGIEELKRINEKMANKDLSEQKYWDYDVEFHTYLASLSNNAVMQSISEIIRDMFKSYKSKVKKLHKVHASTYQDHKNLIEAIENKDVELANSLIIKSLSDSEHALYQLNEEGTKK